MERKIKYPIYIISKNRWQFFKKRRMTWDFLLEENIPFYLVVEPAEAKYYEKITKNLLVLPKNNYGYSTPARNFAWEHSIKLGYKKHWLLDDNIYRLTKRQKAIRRRIEKISNLLFFAEKITECFKKIGLTGFMEEQFLVDRMKRKIINFNKHIYSFILINNELPFRWRLRYNEDVDLNLQIIFSGYYTLQINCFSFHKPRTTALTGGNTDTVYKGNNAKVLKTRTLKAFWPKVVKVVRRFNRTHHHIDWTKFYKIPPKTEKCDKILKELKEVFGSF